MRQNLPFLSVQFSGINYIHLENFIMEGKSYNICAFISAYFIYHNIPKVTCTKISLFLKRKSMGRPLLTCTVFTVCFHPSVVSWDLCCKSSQWLWIALLPTARSKQLLMSLLPVPLGSAPQVELLDWVAILCFILWGLCHPELLTAHFKAPWAAVAMG